MSGSRHRQLCTLGSGSSLLKGSLSRSICSVNLFLRLSINTTLSIARKKVEKSGSD